MSLTKDQDGIDAATKPSKSKTSKQSETNISSVLIDTSHEGFSSMDLDPRIQRAVAKLGFVQPTLVQAKAIPLALEGKDILARARTGSGKTAAYCIPIIQKILTFKTNNASAPPAIRALILVPTRELAEQVHRHIQQLTMYATKEVRSVNISTGDVSVAGQRSILAETPDIIVATPAKIMAHIRENNLELKETVESMVIDEADLILSYGHDEDVKKLLLHLPRILQSYLMSATLSTDVEELRQLVLRNPVILKLEESAEELSMLTQYVIQCEEKEKFLLTFFIFKLHVHPFGSGKAIVFVNTIDRCYKLKIFLESFGIKSCALNSELPLKSRFHIVQEFNKGVYDIIIATDENSGLFDAEDRADLETEEAKANMTVDDKGKTASKTNNKSKRESNHEYGVSRGIDFVNVQAVINFDLPRSSRAYQHRVGRTARGVHNKGYALSFVTNSSEHTVVHSSRKKQRAAAEQQSSKIKQMTDAELLPRIEKRQAAMGREILPFAFDMTQVEGFRYRVDDVLGLITKNAIKEARLKEIKAEILNSEKLKTHFENNPQDFQALRHDRTTHSVRAENHLRHVPNYLLPKGKVGVASGASTGFVPFRVNKKRKMQKGRGKPSSNASKQRADPLKSFKYTAT
ncbi:hypothetical protein BDV3_004046 [Batrachochytrium dendrobatidis]|nr:ATP-dependent DNA/RNA helicase [Batrachochytrium dendrobatidis]